MTETAALWVDRVLPHVGVRQWVLTVPVALRFRLAFDPELTTMVLDAFVRALTASYRRRARRLGHGDGLCGAVTAIQRFSSSLQLNVHFHTLALDGVYVPGDSPGSLRFVSLPPPTDEDVARTLDHARRLIERRLADRGLNQRGDPSAGPLGDCAAASIKGLALLGPGGGLPLGRVMLPVSPQPSKPHGKRCVAGGGYSLHANTAVHALNRRRLEHLARYILRPPIANGRLRERADGKLEYTMKRMWRDGTVAMTFAPLDFMSKLAALVPPPRANQVRYHGVLAPASPHRASVVPAPPPTPPGQAPTCPARRDRKSERTRHALGVPRDVGCGEPGSTGRAAAKRRRLLWAECMKRAMVLDVLACPCGGRREPVAVIDNPPAIRAILEAMHLPTTAPRPHPARPPPQHALSFGRDRASNDDHPPIDAEQPFTDVDWAATACPRPASRA